MATGHDGNKSGPGGIGSEGAPAGSPGKVPTAANWREFVNKGVSFAFSAACDELESEELAKKPANLQFILDAFAIEVTPEGDLRNLPVNPKTGHLVDTKHPCEEPVVGMFSEYFGHYKNDACTETEKCKTTQDMFFLYSGRAELEGAEEGFLAAYEQGHNFFHTARKVIFVCKPMPPYSLVLSHDFSKHSVEGGIGIDEAVKTSYGIDLESLSSGENRNSFRECVLDEVKREIGERAINIAELCPSRSASMKSEMAK